MASIEFHTYGYTYPGSAFVPGQVRRYGFGPYEKFSRATVVLTPVGASSDGLTLGSFSDVTIGDIHVETIPVRASRQTRLDYYVRANVTNSGSKPLYFLRINMGLILN